MKLFSFFVRLPARSGAPTQWIVGEHGAATLEDLLDVLNRQEFILVNQVVSTPDGGKKSIGAVILGRRNIGKVKEWREGGYDG